MSIVATKMLAVRKRNPDFDKNEHRLSQFGALDFFYTASVEAPILTEETKEAAKKSAGKAIQIPVLKYDGSVQVTNSRTCSIPDAENTSALVDVTFVTYFVGFTMVPVLYSNNEIDYNQDFDAKIKKCARALGVALDTAAIAALEAAKTQVYADSLIYPTTGNALQVNWGSREDILGDLEPIMAANDYNGSLHIVGNTGVNSLIRKMAEKSEYNIVDKGLELFGKRFHFSNRLANGEGKFATLYAVEEGNVDMVFRYDREAIVGGAANSHEWDILSMPYLNIPVGIHYYTSVGDQSEIAGDASADITCARKEHYGFSVDVAFITSYNSDLAHRANPIAKVEIEKGVDYIPTVRTVAQEEA